ncbi:hypothetical protein DI487_00470 [Flavobacterium sediminis]|uniref:Uncharacterized protein n=1 Tax=Flavobacterium sediminis TaxID=2201181 RepID=A0A2U8QQZ6_9FLAO|nr:hypothetical protein [Flavobacterium sediminis]AWM12499.1 hypothetical protein DI487_00470 [Flavobacterium sediminis]
MKKITLSFLMVFSFAYSFSQIVSCFNATPICGNNVVISNSTNIASPGAVSCLSTTPNPTWFIFKTGTAGDYEFQLSQGDNAPTYNNQDLDYALWEPFTDLPDCSVELYDYPTGNTAINNNLISCSYSASPTENFSLSNAQAGKFYVVLSTNYSNMAGSILLQQTNLGTTGAGTLICDYVIVNLQPENSTFTTNGNVSFSVASTNALTYKWEMSTDLTDWTILNDGEQFLKFQDQTQIR